MTTTAVVCHTCQQNPADFVAHDAGRDARWFSCSRCKFQAERYRVPHTFTPLPRTMTVEPGVRPSPPPIPRLALVDPATPVPGASRPSDPPTSKAAGGAKVVTKGSHRHLLLAVYATASTGLTDEEACDRAGLSPRSSPWKRCSELRQWGWLAPTGETRETLSGCQAEVCSLSAPGWESYLKLGPPAHAPALEAAP